MITKENIKIFSRFLNLCENDSGNPETEYNKIYLYKDGNNNRRQVTLARGFTQDGGNLWKVLERYTSKGGEYSKFFSKYKTKMKDSNLWQDKEFLSNLVKAGSEKVMKDSQDEIFNEVYLQPALDWAEDNGFKEILSVGVIVDSFLHSGRMTPFLMQKFPERKPSSGGNEKKWIKSYLTERLAWFKRSSDPLHTCMFRPQFFLDEISKNNWELKCPLTLKGKGKIC